jgi:mannose-6-phosphate isomerase-like protein (cupin superfamily)
MSANTLESPATKMLPGHPDYLAPDGSEIRLLPEVSGGGLAHCTLPTGQTKAVVHWNVDEIWFILSGTAQVWRKFGGHELVVDVSPGMSLTVTRGTHFQFRTTGDEPLCLLIATIPRWPGPQEAIFVPGHKDWTSQVSPEQSASQEHL